MQKTLKFSEGLPSRTFYQVEQSDYFAIKVADTEYLVKGSDLNNIKPGDMDITLPAQIRDACGTLISIPIEYPYGIVEGVEVTD